MASPFTLEEQETTIRFDRTNAPAMLYTASAREAERWRKLGYVVTPLGAHGWQSLVPKAAVRLRRLVGGELKKRAVSAAFLASSRKAKA